MEFKGTKEFYEMIESFEKYAKSENCNIYFGCDFQKENKSLWNKQIYYTNGKLNDAFKLFIFGYSCGRCEYINS